MSAAAGIPGFGRLIPGGSGPAGRAWLVTFTDLVCLLLTFFVMLFAMSEPDPRRYAAFAQGLPGDAAPRQDGEAAPRTAFNAEGTDREQAIDLGYLGRVFESQMAGRPELANVRMTRREDHIVLALPSDLLFTSDSAELSPAGRRAVFLLGGVAANLGNAVDVVGHADPATPGPRWPSNWELSLARAGAVADALADAGYQRDITVRGQGDAAFDEVAPWLPEVRRRELARRVDLIVREHRASGEQGGLP